MSDPILKNFLAKHGISEAEFKKFDRTTQSHLTVQANHGEYSILDVYDKLNKHEFTEAYKAAFYCAPVETLMTTSTLGLVLPFAAIYGLSLFPWRQASRFPYFDVIRSRNFLLSKARRTRMALMLGSFVVVNSYLLERIASSQTAENESLLHRSWRFVR